MKIGIIGSGAVGQTLGTAFLAEGHQVMLGTRDTAKEAVVKWLTANTAGQAGSFEAVAKFGEVLVLATEGNVAANAIDLAGKENFTGKTVIDATNPIAKGAPVNGVLQFFTSLDDSLMERLQRQLPEAHFVKAFSSVGSHLMYKPDFGGIKPTMFICGNDAGAKNTVTGILDAFGWETEDMGAAEAARAIEPLCMLWCIPGFTQNRWTHAFKLLKK
jgi:8-hydroxy-5-deazaflavin:NADPH oxidoreductase